MFTIIMKPVVLQQDIYLMAEFGGRRGVRNDEGSLQLDVESDHLQPDSASNGPM